MIHVNDKSYHIKLYQEHPSLEWGVKLTPIIGGGGQTHTHHWRGVQTQNVVEIGTELPYDHGHL